MIRIKALKYLSQDNIQDLRKRVTVLDCQLRKSESARKTFEVATEKLLQFVEVTLTFISSDFFIWKNFVLMFLSNKHNKPTINQFVEIFSLLAIKMVYKCADLCRNLLNL